MGEYTQLALVEISHEIGHSLRTERIIWNLIWNTQMVSREPITFCNIIKYLKATAIAPLNNQNYFWHGVLIQWIVHNYARKLIVAD